MGVKLDPKRPGKWKASYSKRHPITRKPKTLTRTGFSSQAQAKRVYEKLIVEVEDQLRRVTSPVWGEFVEVWIEAVEQSDIFAAKLTPSALTNYSRVLRNYTDEWKNKFVEDITTADAWTVLHKVETELSKSKAKKLRSAIDNVYNFGIRSGRLTNIKVVPTAGYKSVKREEEKKPEILSKEEIRLFLNYSGKIDHLWHSIWTLALFTGMRSGELFALNWRSIDLEAGTIVVHENWINKIGIGPTKGRYWRTVPICSELSSFLKKLKLKAKGGYSEKVWRWNKTRTEKVYYIEEEFVLPRFQCWKDGRQAGILREFLTGIGVTSVKFHTLRSCFATQLLRVNVAPAIVMKICGWKDLKTTQRYVRLAGIEVKGATEGLRFLDAPEAMAQVVELFKK